MWPQCQCFVTRWMTSLREEDWNVLGDHREKLHIVRQLACFCHCWSVWLLRLVVYCGFSQGIWRVKCHSTFSRPTTSLSLFLQFTSTHPFHTHFLRALRLLSLTSVGKRAKVTGRASLSFLLLSKGKEFEAPLHCMMPDKHIHCGHKIFGEYWLSLSKYSHGKNY